MMKDQRIDDMGPPFEPATPEEFLAQAEAAFEQWWESLTGCAGTGTHTLPALCRRSDD